jgi:cytochrome bd ubiquinol oxidase subunit I
MDNLLAARSQMAMSLAFHIIFAMAGIAMPLMMLIAEWLWWRKKDHVYLDLAKRWAKGTAILFAVGAVSGTVLSFELGLLWPQFMKWAGPIIGMPFSLEGFAFFTEAIFLGVYLYGWERISTPIHLMAGLIVAVSGAASAIFVVIANAWMNTPTGFVLVNGKAIHIDPMAAMMNPHAFPQVVHMLLASYAATGFAVAGIHAFILLKRNRNAFHQHALAIALIVGGVGAILQPLSGDSLAKAVAKNQPVKLAGFEGHFNTEKGAPLRIGGIPDEQKEHTPFAIEIPYGLSLLAYGDPSAEVKGLKEFPREEWPPVPIIHIAFQVMVGCGFAMMAIAAWGLWLRRKKKSVVDSQWYLRSLVAAAPLGVIAVETGWTVTEVGRQPWIIYGVMKTKDAVTPMPGLIVPFITFTLIYIFLGFVVISLLIQMVRQSPGMENVKDRS